MTISNKPTGWRQYKRRSVLTPTIIQEIFKAYLQEISDRGITTADEVQMVRPEITQVIADKFGVGYGHIYKILSRKSWGEQPIPDGWISYL